MKVDDRQWSSARLRLDAGESMRTVAQSLGISPQAVQQRYRRNQLSPHPWPREVHLAVEFVRQLEELAEGARTCARYYGEQGFWGAAPLAAEALAAMWRRGGPGG